MKNLQEATERICELKGSLIALDALVPAVIEALSEPSLARLTATFEAHAEAARTVMLHADISDLVLTRFERDVARTSAVLRASARPPHPFALPGPADALLLAMARISRLAGTRVLGHASGFFFRRGDRLFLVSHGQAFAASEAGQAPDRIGFELHTDALDLTRRVQVSLPVRVDGHPVWREAADPAGPIDVALIEVPSGSLPADACWCAFDETHLVSQGEAVSIGDGVTVVGFPDGQHDAVHELAVARGACVASAYGVRYRDRACFLIDAQAPAGSGGGPVLRRRPRDRAAGPELPWQLLGVQSGNDEALGLSCAWYADVLTRLTTPD